MARRFSAFNLKRLRQEAGYSRMDLALALGVHFDTVRNWERPGVQTPSRDRLLALADLLACDLNELFEEVVVDA